MVLRLPQKQDKSIPAQAAYDTEKLFKIGNILPAIINGRLSYNKNRNSASAKKKNTSCASAPNPNTKEHKVTVVGDSHVKETAARIDQFLNSKTRKPYNLTSTVNFLTKCHKHSATSIDNILIDIDRKKLLYVMPDNE
jgi:hypothetical protein